VPEVHHDHRDLIKVQRRLGGGSGAIVTTPNCSVAGLVMPLAPLDRALGVRRLVVTTMQALSGAGYPGPSAIDMVGNVLPYIGGGEEEKVETEPLKILGRLEGQSIRPAAFKIS